MISRPRFSHVRVLTCSAVTVVAIGAAACSSDSDSASGSALKVTASDTACELDRSTFKAGDLSVEVMNEGDQVTEVYVYGKEDRVMGEVENIGPDTSRSFAVKLGGGEYEVACKPGQTGKGIRSELTITGKKETLDADRSVSFESMEYSFEGLTDLAVKTGETIEFRMHNEGRDEHEFEVLDASGKALGEIGPTKADASGVVVLKFEKPGTYRYLCDIEDHRSQGMTGTFTVS